MGPADQEQLLAVPMVAVLAMSAVVATAAQAQFTANSYPKSATAESGSGNDEFITEASSLTCKSHYLFVPLAAPSNTTTVTVTNTQCLAYGFSATFNMNGCDYTFHDTAVNLENKVTPSTR